MEQKDENKKEKKSQLLIAAIIFIAALGFVLNFGGDKLNNNLHYYKKYIEAVDDMMSEDFDTANAKFSIVFDEFKNYKNTEYFRDFCQACTYYKNDKFIEAGNELPDYGANYRLSGKQRDLVEKWTEKIQSKYKYAIEHPTKTIPFEEEYSEFVSRYRSTSQSSESEYTTAKRSTGAKGSSFYPRPSRNSSSGSEGKTSKKTTKNIQLKEPLLKRQQQRNTIRMMRQIITIPKIFIMITTTISLITKKRKIISTNTIK